MFVADFIFLFLLTSTVFVVSELKKFLERSSAHRAAQSQHSPFKSGRFDFDVVWLVLL